MKTTPITIYLRGKEEKDWYLGVWSYTPEQQCWGLVVGDITPTQMAYRWPQDNAKEIVERNRANYLKDPDPDWLCWYFDVGRKLYATLDDLEVACRKLSIWDDEDGTSCKSVSTHQHPPISIRIVRII